ncbi:MAG: oligosaccharide flippase family protein [Eubacterium sp.]|nr:oligosaccharide flippase family protein [Eubacterium sp.]
MSNDAKALKSGVWYAMAVMMQKGIWIVTIPLFSRLLTKAEFGAYNNYTAWLAVLTIIVTLNLESTFLSAINDFRKTIDEYVLSLLCLGTISTAFFTIIINVFHTAFENLFSLRLLYINAILVYLLFLPALTLFQTRDRFLFKYKTSALATGLTALASELLALALVFFSKDDRLTMRIVGSVIPTVVIGAIFYAYFIKTGKRVKIKYWKYALPIALPYVPHLISMVILSSTDKIMITKICGEADNAMYSIAYTCGMAITALVMTMNNAYSPWLADKLHNEDRQSVKSMSDKYFGFFAFCTVGVMLLSPELLLVLGGKQYYEARFIVPPIIMGCVFQFAYTMFVNIEQFKKKTVGMSIASVIAAALNCLLNLLLIPKFGYEIAAYTTVVSYAALYGMHYFLVKRLGYADVYKNTVIWIEMAGLIAAMFVSIVLYSHTVIRYITVGVYVVLLVFIALKSLPMIRQIMKKES